MPRLVSDPLGGHLALELGKRQEYVQGQPTHRGCSVELLSDRNKRHTVLIEQLNKLGKVGQGPCQAVDLVDDDDVDLASPDILQKPLQCWPVGIAS
jgi:hypothetical protein